MSETLDKVAVVTGGSRGIGRACAEALTRGGWSVAIGYRTSEADAKETLASLGRTADVTHVTDVVAIAEYAVMSTPALVVDGEVKVQGHLPRREDLQAWLSA